MISEHFYNEKYWDKKLNIKTSGIIQLNNRSGYANYEPTSYEMLELLVKNYPFADNDHCIDFGCGLGRVLCFFAAAGCKCLTGVECNEKIFIKLKQNIKNCRYENYIHIANEVAEKYVVPADANKFFFFNPFHLKYFIKTILNIVRKTEKEQIYFFLYDPASVYLDFLKSINIVTTNILTLPIAEVGDLFVFSANKQEVKL